MDLARRRSGFVRDFNLWDVIVFNVFGYSIGLAISTNPSFIGGYSPQAHLVGTILLGSILAAFNGVVYGLFAAIMPSTGGDYNFVGRVLSHRLGFLASWGFTVCQLYGLATNTSWIVSIALIPALVSHGHIAGQASLLSAAEALSVGSRPVLIAFALLCFLCFVSTLRAPLLKFVAYLLFGMALLSTALMGYVLFTSSNADFIRAFNSFVQSRGGPPNGYVNALSIATSAGIPATQNATVLATLKAVPLGFLFFLGFTYSAYIGGEVRRPQRNQLIGIFAALLIGIAAFVLICGRYISVVGQSFNTAVALSSTAEHLKLPANSVNFFVGLLAPSPTISILIHLGNLVWFLVVPFVILQVCVRNIMAWACDEMLPPEFLARTRRTGAPWLAISVVCVVGLAIQFLNWATGVSLVGAVALVAVPFCLTGIAAFRLKKLRPEVFAGTPATIKRRVCGIPLFEFSGFVSAVAFVWVLYATLTQPEIAGGSSAKAIFMVLITYAIGLLIYQWRVAHLRHKHGELTWFTVIPGD